jgi:hypothetical protein
MSRHRLFKSFVYLLFILLLSEKLPAQKDLFPFPAFEKITTAQGLSNNEVYEVTQDKKGFIWCFQGLDRYDGYSFNI